MGSGSSAAKYQQPIAEVDISVPQQHHHSASASSTVVSKLKEAPPAPEQSELKQPASEQQQLQKQLQPEQQAAAGRPQVRGPGAGAAGSYRQRSAAGGVTRAAASAVSGREKPPAAAAASPAPAAATAAPPVATGPESATPNSWRKGWDRPEAVFEVQGKPGVPRFLPPLRNIEPGRSALPPVSAEQLAASSAVARMAAEYWRNEQARGGEGLGPGGSDHSRPATGSPSGGSVAAGTSTTQSWNSRASQAISASSAASSVVAPVR
eukprot:TRINITY_DN23233_c0_g1_i2.p1 TRINITY_DN23233_c0_g1~~TRINITY_DN23233_c0_g1_i2.p1  ORF type:complete len:282 (+),score=54.45 TRINITY_DN23233_c0_g1_i2:52-846(+)